MSMMYCHEHDRHWDSDYHEDCADCMEALTMIEEESALVELLKADTYTEGGSGWSGMFAVCCKFIGPEEIRRGTNEPKDTWRVVWESNDLHRVLKDACDLAKGSRFYKYAVRVPATLEDRHEDV